MQPRWISLGLFLSFLICYFEWSDQSMYLFQMEMELFFTEKRNLQNFSHPLILLPFIGQLLLLVPVFRKSFPLKYVLIANLLLGLLVFMVLLTGSLTRNIKMVASVIPFIFFTILMIRAYRKERMLSKTSRLRN